MPELIDAAEANASDLTTAWEGLMVWAYVGAQAFSSPDGAPTTATVAPSALIAMEPISSGRDGVTKEHRDTVFWMVVKARVRSAARSTL